jgi:NAD(P)H-nitrite reductase large subunit
MAVSGCKLSCAESWVRDVGLIGNADGWKLVAGGNVGASPRIAEELLTGLDDDQAMEAAKKVVEFYQENAKKGERLGKMIDRIGIEPLKDAVA